MRQTLMILAGAGSAALLAAAFAFQHLGGLAPCPICLWQRWPHAVAVLIGLVAILVPARALAWLGAAAALATAGLGLYHTGVERGWWQGPDTCAAGPVSGISAEQLLDQILAAPVVRCTDVAWEMLGLSMASSNGLASLGLAILWIGAAARR